jgi:hypothetical protein
MGVYRLFTTVNWREIWGVRLARHQNSARQSKIRSGSSNGGPSRKGVSMLGDRNVANSVWNTLSLQGTTAGTWFD